MAFRNEEWIVAKTALPSGRKADPAIAHALEQFGFQFGVIRVADRR